MSPTVIALTFLGFILLRVALIGLGSVLLVRRVRSCPACFKTTTPILRPWIRRITGLEWRWCSHCGWKGPSRPGKRGAGGGA